jgi:RNA polymerase sigma factor (sigma-70 family)
MVCRLSFSLVFGEPFFAESLPTNNDNGRSCCWRFARSKRTSVFASVGRQKAQTMQVDNPADSSICAGELELNADQEMEIAGKDSELASWKKVFQHAYSLVGNQAEAEDLTQDTFVELFRAQAAGAPVHWLSAWMRTVTTRLAYRSYRQHRPDLHVSLETVNGDGTVVTWDQPDPRPSPEEQVIDQSMVRMSARVLSEFSTRDRECVLMYFQGYDFAQIASTLGVSRWTARRVTLDVIQRVRTKLSAARE